MSDESKYCKFAGWGKLVGREQVFDTPGNFHFFLNEGDGRTYFLANLKDTHCCIPVNAIGDTPNWKWNGDEKFPTIEPSIHVIGHWHGFVRAGEFISC